ncbi:MAG: hypothetical protein L6R48_19410, partial [Planctomycetes bacterium]|nr:hypothetical protein [Planctomycetota bacterium]
MNPTGLTSRFLRRVPDGVLAVESDGVQVRAAVLRPHPSGRPAVAAIATSSAPAFAAALTEVVAALRARLPSLPAQAVHLSSQVHTAVLTLPVDPRRPLPPHQMRELVRWELEPYHRFDGPVVCGWTALAAPPRDRRWSWLAAGTTQPYRQHLIECYAGQGLVLRAIHPLAGCAPAALRADAATGATTVLESQENLLVCTRLDGTAMAECRSLALGDGADHLSVAGTLLDGGGGPVWLAGRWDAADVGALAAISGRPCTPLPVATSGETGMPAWRWAGMAGAAATLDGGNPTAAVTIPPSDPVPPLTADRRVRLAAATGLLALAAAATALVLGRGTARQEALLTAQRTLEARRQELRAAEERLAGLDRRLAMLEQRLPARMAFLPGLLQALAACASDEVQVEALAEDAAGALDLRGWGRSAARIQAFRI